MRIDLSGTQDRAPERRHVGCIGEALWFQGNAMPELGILLRQRLASVELQSWLVAAKSQGDPGALRAQYRSFVRARVTREAMIVATGDAELWMRRPGGKLQKS